MMRHHTTRATLFVVPLLALQLDAASVTAEEGAEPEEAARGHDERAAELFSSGEYTEALREIQSAQALSPSPVREYNMASCHERLGHLPEAIELYQRFLSSADIPHDRRRTAEERLESLRATLEDGIRGDEEERPPPAQSRRRLRPAGFFGALGCTLAAGVAMSVLGGVTLSRHSDFVERRDASDDLEILIDDQKTGQNLALATNVLLGVTSAAALATVILAIFTRWGGEEETSARLRILPVLRADGIDVALSGGF